MKTALAALLLLSCLAADEPPRATSPPIPASAWTVETSQQHLLDIIAGNDKRYEQQFADEKEAVNAALLSAQQAVTKAEMAAEKRFESVNEFRGQMNDQSKTFMPRGEADGAIKSLNERVSGFMPRAEVDGQIKALNDKVLDLASRVNVEQGQSAGSSATWAYILLALGGLGAVFGIVGALAAVISVFRKPTVALPVVAERIRAAKS
jgi:hypothetical protein